MGRHDANLEEKPEALLWLDLETTGTDRWRSVRDYRWCRKLLKEAW